VSTLDCLPIDLRRKSAGEELDFFVGLLALLQSSQLAWMSPTFPDAGGLAVANSLSRLDRHVGTASEAQTDRRELGLLYNVCGQTVHNQRFAMTLTHNGRKTSPVQCLAFVNAIEPQSVQRSAKCPAAVCRTNQRLAWSYDSVSELSGCYVCAFPRLSNGQFGHLAIEIAVQGTKTTISAQRFSLSNTTIIA